MSIKRFFANADNTITNAFASNLTTRGTGSNMGASDILEVFSIYGQASSTSLEKARSLVQFDVSKIKAARDAGTIAQSGSVKFFLRLYNAEHGQTLPKNYSLSVLPVSQSWSEGSGLDMEEYSDLDISNWIFASDTKVADVTDVKFVSTTPSDYDGKYFILQVVNDDKTTTRLNFWFDDDGAGSAPNVDGTEVEVQINQANANTVKRFAREVKVAVDALASTNLSASISEDDTGDATGATVRLTNTVVGGTSGSFIPTVHNDGNVFTLTIDQRGGPKRWSASGGDYHEVTYVPTKTLPNYTYAINDGTEDIELNVTALVEEWILAESTVDPDRENYGVMIKMADQFEDGSQKRSYYTKKFFARGTEFFYKRPCIEARFDNHIGDDRANFYKSSSLATGPENLNKLYMYNYTRRGLTNMPTLKTNSDGTDQTTGESLIKVRLYPDQKSSTKALVLPVGGGVTDGRAKTKITVSGNPGNGETFVVTDYEGTAVTFTINTASDSVAGGVVGIQSNTGNNTQIAGKIKLSIEATALKVTVTDNNDGTIDIVQNAIGTDGNRALSMAGVTNVAAENNAFTTGHAQDFTVGYLHETGIYSASLAFTGSQTKVFDVWSDLTDNQLFTGSAIYVKEHKPLPFSNADEEYVVSIANLKPHYRTKDKPSLRVNIRKKDYQPNIYTVASNKIQNEVLYNVYYRAYRVIDGEEVISYGSGSVPHTKMSYDSSGSYFKVDMSLFEPGYMYALEISTDSYEQNIVNKSEFKFRVE